MRRWPNRTSKHHTSKETSRARDLIAPIVPRASLSEWVCVKRARLHKIRFIPRKTVYSAVLPPHGLASWVAFKFWFPIPSWQTNPLKERVVSHQRLSARWSHFGHTSICRLCAWLFAVCVGVCANDGFFLFPKYCLTSPVIWVCGVISVGKIVQLCLVHPCASAV